VTVQPQPADPAATDPTTGGTTPAITGKTTTGRHKRHKSGAFANSDTRGTAQTGPVTTGVEPACDADGDGVTDPGAPSSCSSGSTVTTGVQQGNAAPVPYSAPRKHKAAAKKKLRQRRARAR
jgi:hypothetical protein